MRAFRAVATIIIVTVISLLFVHQQVEMVKISYMIDVKEKTLKDILDHNEGLGYNIDNLESPSRLEEALLEKRIEVAFPKRGHVVRLASASHRSVDKRPYVFKTSKKNDLFAFINYLTPKASSSS